VTQEQAPPDSGTTGSAKTSSGRRARALVAAFLALVVVASGATLVWLVSQRSGEPAEVQREREQVMSVARSFVLRINTYGPDLLAEDGTMPAYREEVEEVISSKLEASFTESAGLAEATVSQAGLGRTAEVFAAGVLSIDDDSATALVAGEFTNTYPDPEDDAQRVEDLPLPLRLRIEMVKVDGEWLVDDFEPVLGEQAPALVPAPTETPTAPSTPVPTPPSEEPSP
jgi:Mce-associated membrane protein